VPRLLLAMIEDDPDYRREFCEWICRKVGEDPVSRYHHLDWWGNIWAEWYSEPA